MDSAERLLEIKFQIEEAKTEQSEITGQIKSITDQMQQGFNIVTLPEAEKELERLGKELDKEETKFKKDQEELENAYDWD